MILEDARWSSEIRMEYSRLVARRDSADSGSGVAELSYLEIKLTRLVLSIAV